MPYVRRQMPDLRSPSFRVPLIHVKHVLSSSNVKTLAVK